MARSRLYSQRLLEELNKFSSWELRDSKDENLKKAAELLAIAVNKEVAIYRPAAPASQEVVIIDSELLKEAGIPEAEAGAYAAALETAIKQSDSESKLQGLLKQIKDACFLSYYVDQEKIQGLLQELYSKKMNGQSFKFVSFTLRESAEEKNIIVDFTFSIIQPDAAHIDRAYRNAAKCFDEIIGKYRTMSGMYRNTHPQQHKGMLFYDMPLTVLVDLPANLATAIAAEKQKEVPTAVSSVPETTMFPTDTQLSEMASAVEAQQRRYRLAGFFREQGTFSESERPLEIILDYLPKP